MSEACVRRVVSGVLLTILMAVLVGCRGMSSSDNNNNNGGSTNSGPANPTANLTVSPNTIQQNGTVTLSWTTTNATSVTLTQNDVSVPLDGNPLQMTALQLQVNTVGTTTFKLTATGASGTTPASSSAAVNVTPPPPPPVAATLTAVPTTVQVGGAVVLTWTTTNAKHATLTQDGVDLHINQLNGSMQVTLTTVGTVVFQLTADDGLGHQVMVQASVQVTNGNTGDINSVQHIIFLAQENRSFDVYFGKLNEYRVANGWGGPSDVDGLPDDCSSTNSDWNIPCSAMNKSPDANGFPTTPVYAFHLKTMCIENTSADWIVSHWAFNAEDPNSDIPKMDGFVIGAASAAPPDGDKAGIRAMGFYTAADLPYHYWLASEFGVSDRWFSPAPVRTEPNRFYLVGGTSAGYAYPKVHPEPQINADTIFDRLETAGVSWKIYTNKNLTTSASAFRNFMQKYGPGSPEPHVFTLDQFYTDLTNGTLPAVAYIDKQDRDEHPGLGDHIQFGVLQTKEIVDALMASSAWKTSVFIMTFDEAGGLYDHVPPSTTVVSPDGIAPFDICVNANDPRCPTAALTHTPPPYDPTGDFTRYGFRVPAVVVSPFSKPHYVSHTVTDSTSWLAFVEARFKIQPLTARDAAADNLVEFFDFKNAPWLTPPTPPNQPTNGPCYDGLP
jgi:phospholipase C